MGSFYSKDYGEYFAQLEKEVEIKARMEEREQKNENLSAEDFKRKRRQKLILKARLIRAGVAILCLAVVVGLVSLIISVSKGEKTATPKKTTADKKEKATLYAKATKDTDNMSKVKNLYKGDGTLSGIESESGIIVNLKNKTVLSSKNESKRLSPASLTKIMTLLVAVENITDYEQTFTMSYKIINPIYGEASMAGYSSGEVLTVDDLLYGTILPSGGEAAVGLGVMISGSEEEFVKLMNDKAKQLGLKNTNFANCTGLYDSNHYTTAEDLAVIFSQALKNDKCREILTTQKYVSSDTSQHPGGLTLHSDLFLNMKGTESEGADVLGGKTGFVSEAGFCLATFAKDSSGNEFICITLNADSKWPAFYDHINIYSAYTKKES
ncbi:MAG: D-alanyl-D-alanine carboxypeptidase [Clostridia bacterium]|nr:D-alanyl-D-alanine carboxypeptidase [Clostridia bacterium]